jgi:zinc/manganese transport system substrate-binding protein
MKRILTVFLFAIPLPALAGLNILACEPEWGALSKEIGGEKVRVTTAITALQDPHRVEARPSLIARARDADLMICTGAELEIGWVPLLQRQAGNAKIQVGQPGYFEAASAVPLIERPTRVDRSLGDVHPSGNPHIHLDPRNIERVAAALAERMASLDSREAAYYRERGRSFLGRWSEAMSRWQAQAGPLKGLALVVYHKDTSYLIQWLAMREVGALEPKPGLPPSAAHLNELLDGLRRTPARAVLRSAYNDPRPAEWLAAQAGIPVVLLPFTVGGTENAKDLFGLFDDTVNRLLAITK